MEEETPLASAAPTEVGASFYEAPGCRKHQALVLVPECNNQINGPTLLGIEASRYLSIFLDVSVRMFDARIALAW